MRGDDDILNIAVVAFNYVLALRACKVLADNDTDTKIKRKCKEYIEMEDGTRYKHFSNYNNARGHKIDQIILVDDFRWDIYQEQFELIDYLKSKVSVSCVPDEFLIQQYEYPLIKMSKDYEAFATEYECEWIGDKTK